MKIEIIDEETPMIAEKFAAWKEKYRTYDQAEFLDIIAKVASKVEDIEGIKYVLWEGDRKYLQDKFGFDLYFNTNPSLIGSFVYNFLSEVVGLSDDDLEHYVRKFANPAIIEAAFLQECFSRHELREHLGIINRELHALVNVAALEEQCQILRDKSGGRLVILTAFNSAKSSLDQAVLFFGLPIFDIFSDTEIAESDICDNLNALWDYFIGEENETEEIVDELLFNRGNLEGLLSSFFARKINSMVVEGIIPEDQAAEITRGIVGQYLIAYQKMPIFDLFKPYFLEDAAESDKRLLTEVADDVEEYSEEDLGAVSALSRVVNKKVFQSIAKICRELIKMEKKKIDILPTTPDLYENQVLKCFIFKLFMKHYALGEYPIDDAITYDMGELVGFLNEVFIRSSSPDLYKLDYYLGKLREELKKAKYEDSTVPDYATITSKIGKVVKSIEEFGGIIRDIDPTVTLSCRDQEFLLLNGLQQIVIRARKIVENFDKLTAEKRLLDEAQAAKIARELDELAAENRALMSRKEEVAAASAVVRLNHDLSCRSRGVNRGLCSLEGYDLRGSSTLSQPQLSGAGKYDIYATDEIADLLERFPSVKEEFRQAICGGFLGSEDSKATAGIKTMHLKDEGGAAIIKDHVIVEVKLVGRTSTVYDFLGYDNVNLGDIRFCGVVRNGALLLTHATLHGKKDGNEELRAAVDSIKIGVNSGDIAIGENKRTPSVVVAAAAVVGRARRK